MSELAFTVTGDAFEVPATVTAWRVRRLKPRGASELVYARDGRPLTLPIESDLDDLRDAVSTSGKYRLDPINDGGKCVEDVPAAYIQIIKGERNGDGTSDRISEPRADLAANASLAQAVIEAVKLNAEALRQNAEISMRAVDKLPQLMEAMTTMLNVAAGTQLYALQQREVTPALRNRADNEDDIDDEGDDDDAANGSSGADEPPPSSGFAFPIPGFDLNKAAGHMAAECMTKLMDRITAMFGGGKLPSQAAAPAPVIAQPAATTPVAPPASAPQPRRAPRAHAEPQQHAPSILATPSGIPTDPASMMHFAEMQNALTPAEREDVLAIAAAFTDEERAGWFTYLRSLSVPEAVATVRAVLQQVAAIPTSPPDAPPPPSDEARTT